MLAFYLLGVVIFGVSSLRNFVGLIGEPSASGSGDGIALILSVGACALFLMLTYGRLRRAGYSSAPGGGKSFHTKLVGVTHKNPDGKSRQRLIKEHCRPGEQLIVRPEPTNQYDPNAVAVYVEVGSADVQLGYFSERVAAEVSQFIKRGGKVSARVSEVTGGSADKPTLGVNVEVMKSAG